MKRWTKPTIVEFSIVQTKNSDLIPKKLGGKDGFSLSGVPMGDEEIINPGSSL